MGKRYQAILKHISEYKDMSLTYDCYDIANGEQRLDYDKYSHVIIATPTDNHKQYLNDLLDYKGAILCEKPIIKGEVGNIIENRDIEMMFQYAYLYRLHPYNDLKAVSHRFGHSSKDETASTYNYYNTGKDGLYWDCLQIIGLHRGPIHRLKIMNESPIWSCTINAETLFIGHMDNAYVKAVFAWLNGFRFKKDLIRICHEKVLTYSKSAVTYDKGVYSDSGKIDIKPIPKEMF
jgi:hypothetical protein